MAGLADRSCGRSISASRARDAQRRRVDGVTRKATQRSRGMTRLAAARRTRSMARSLRGPDVRCSTRS